MFMWWFWYSNCYSINQFFKKLITSKKNFLQRITLLKHMKSITIQKYSGVHKMSHNLYLEKKKNYCAIYLKKYTTN